jgi:hypothetical protein
MEFADLPEFQLARIADPQARSDPRYRRGTPSSEAAAVASDLILANLL